MDPFISTDDLEAYIGETLADPAALNVAIALDSACQAVRSYIGQTINRTTTTEVYDGTGLRRLRLRERPVRAIGSIVVDGTPLGWDQFVVVGNTVKLTDGSVFTYGIANVSVQYNHGWDIDMSEPDAIAVPADLRKVALSVAARTFRTTDNAVDESLESETIGQYSYTRRNVNDAATTGGFLTAEAAVLDRYVVRLTPGSGMVGQLLVSS